MTGERERAVETLKENLCAMCAYGSQSMASCDIRGCDNRDAIKALEQESRPMEKFESTKDHIYKLAGDYKCWDNRLTWDEALELCHILEKEPCEDAISRQAVLNTLDNMDKTLDEDRTVENYKELLKECYEILPPVNPQPKIGHWIPVSERLPESDGSYLLFGKVVEDDAEDIFIGMYDSCAEKFGYWEDYYDRSTLGFLDSELIEYNKVIAWMPLPEPYKAESEE